MDNPENSLYVESYEVYQPLLPKRLLMSNIMKYLPFMPNPVDGNMPRTLTQEFPVDEDGK